MLATILLTTSQPICPVLERPYNEYDISRAISQRLLFDFLQDQIKVTSEWKENNDGIIVFDNNNIGYFHSYADNNKYTVIFRLETQKKDYVRYVSSPRVLSKDEEDVFFQTVKWQILSLFEKEPMGMEDLLFRTWSYPVD